MILTVGLKLDISDSGSLKPMMRRFNEACDWLSGIAFEEKLWHWHPLQKRAYYELRERFGFTSAQALVAIRKVAYCYRNKQRRDKRAGFRPLGGIPLFKHVYYPDRTVRFYGLRMPYDCRPGTELPRQPKEGKLVCRDGEFFIQQSVEVEEPEEYEPSGWLGCDLGIVNILTDGDGQRHSGAQVNGLRHRHARLRGRLQAKATKSAKRRLRCRSRKEAYFARDVNHCIAKKTVAKAIRQRKGVALEDLKGIRARLRVRKAHRRQLHSWAFAQLQDFITYKARLGGVPVALVDPRNTSRTCPKCGSVEKKNRKSQARFECVCCGFGGHADHIAAINIGRRAAGNQPHAAAA